MGYFDPYASGIGLWMHLFFAAPYTGWLLLAILAAVRGPTPLVWFCFCLMVPLSLGGGLNMGVIFTAAVVFGALYFVIKRGSKDVRAKKRAQAYAARAPLKRGGAPDHPPNLQGQIQWIAVRSNSTAKVASTLGLQDAEPTNWANGVEWGRDYGAAIEGQTQTPCFISPEVEGWVFVLLARPLITRREIDSVLAPLSQAFGEAQAFVRLPGEHGIYGWHKAVDGVMVRSFSQTRSRGMRSFGEPTEVERSVLSRDQLRGPRTTPRAEQGLSAAVFAATDIVPPDDWPDQPFKVAQDWSLDPTDWPDTDADAEWLGLAGFLEMEPQTAHWMKAKV